MARTTAGKGERIPFRIVAGCVVGVTVAVVALLVNELALFTLGSPVVLVGLVLKRILGFSDPAFTIFAQLGTIVLFSFYGVIFGAMRSWSVRALGLLILGAVHICCLYVFIILRGLLT